MAVLSAACGKETGRGSASAHSMTHAASSGGKVKAADLRAGLTGLLTEHVYLASEATGAALRGDTKGFDAFATALNGPSNSNTSDVVDAITGVYGAQVGKAFDGLWRSNGHIPAFVAYTQAAARNDAAGKQKARSALAAYAKTFGETLHSVNENLPAAAVQHGLEMHAATLIAVIDAQTANNPTAVYTALRKAYAHMNEFAAILADATAKKFPDKIDGNAMAPASTLQAGLTSLLREHVFLAASATGAALRGATSSFTAAAGALNGPSNSNTSDIVAAVTSAYGPEVGKAFDGLWRSNGHIPAFVAYTQAVASNNAAGAKKALEDLVAYAKTFGATMHTVNTNLPAVAVTEDITMHATTLKAVIDDEKAKDAAKEAQDLRTAVKHMSGTAKLLADATVAKFPDKFAG
jgi:hypothetical protein